jgi:hypothetical protein
MPNLQSHLVLERCPHCRVANPNINLVQKFQTNAFDKSNLRYWGIYSCNRCGGVTTASSRMDSGIILEMFPSQIEIDISLPEKAKAFLHQAVDSLHAPSGVIMLAASSIDAMLKEKGYTSGKLYTRINNAAKDHLITSGMAEWAHEVRLDANDERHADEDAKLPDGKDAKKTVDFALALAEFLFILPSKVQSGIKEATEPEKPTT